MTNEVVNVAPHIEIQNNTWTLLKHAAHSVNVAAGKVDAKVYGPIVKQGTVQLPPQRYQPAPVPPQDNNIFTIIGYVVVAILGIAAFIGIFIAWCKGAISGRDLIGI